MTLVAHRAPTERRAWVEHLMGMPMSIHVRGEGARADDVAAAVALTYATLRELEATFSTYRADSQVSRLQRGELDDADPQFREVEVLCRRAGELTGGWFDAWNAVPGRPGLFDPTGLVKTWAVARAARPLREIAAAHGLGFAVGAGGDVLTVPGADGEPWLVGVEDPLDRSAVVATFTAHDGGVATSGITARGTHILDPRTGTPATAVLCATVAGPSLVWADVHATALVAMGDAALDRVGDLHGTSGLLVLADGTRHPWSIPA